MFIILHCLRGVTSLAFLLISTGAQNYYSLFETTTERKLKWANIVQSIFSLVYNILSICFTLGFFCPQFGHVWIRYVEWYYLANLTVLVMYCCSVESGNEADLDAVSDASNTRPVKEIQTPVVRVLNVVNSTSSSSYMRPPRPDHGLSGISDRRQSTLLSLPSSSSQPNSRRQSINPANHHNNQISSALLTVINNNSNRGEVSRSTSFFSRFTSFSRRRDHQLDELIRQSSQATVMLDDYGRQVDISTRHQRQELGLSSENTIATTPRRYFFLTPIFFDFNLTIPIEIAGFAITLFISLAIFAIHLLDIFYLRDAKSGVPTVLLTLYAIFTFFQVGFKVLNSPTTTTTAMMANQNSPRHYLWRVLLAIVLIVGVVVPFLVVPSYAFYLSYGLLPLITLLWASSTTVKGKSRFAQLVLPAKTPRSMWRTSDSSLFGNNGERDQHRSNAVSTSRTSFGSGPRATRTRPSTTSVVSWGGSAAQSSRGTGLLNNNGVGSGVGDFSWGFSSTVAAASPHLKTKILKMLISMYMVFATCVASVAGQYLPVAVSACLVCVAWLFGLRRQPENSNAILRQILLWATGITFVVLFIVLSQIPFLLVSSSTSWMALKGKVAVFGYLSDGTIANLPSVIVDAGGVGAYFTLNVNQKRETRKGHTKNSNPSHSRCSEDKIPIYPTRS